MGSMKSSGGGSTSVGISLLHLSEYDELPPPPPNANHQQQQRHAPLFAHGQPHAHDYANLSGLGGISDDNISEEGKLLACVRDDSITYASTRDLEPPHPAAATRPPPPPPPLPVKGGPTPQPPAVLPHPGTVIYGRAPQAMPEMMQLSPEHHPNPLQQHPLQPQQLKQQLPSQHPLQQSSNPHQHLVSPLAPVTVAVHTNEAHVSGGSGVYSYCGFRDILFRWRRDALDLVRQDSNLFQLGVKIFY